jgi:hypothetical protein
VKVTLPVATVERFGGIADFQNRSAIKCDCCAIADEPPTAAEVANKVITTVAIATTDTFASVEPYTNDEYSGFTQ